MTWPAALLDPRATPAGLRAPPGLQVSRRFDIYRNNVMASLVQAMRDGFPVIRRLVGEEFFAAMAKEFVRAHPPSSPRLSLYGDGFADFLASFQPAATLPYLPDMARLELALRLAYHAADAHPIAPERLRDPDVERARLTLAPAVRVLASPYPIHAIRKANMDPGAPAPTAGAQSVLVTRADWVPLPEVVPETEARFIADLATLPLGEAAARTPDLDLATALTRLVARKAIVSLEIPA